jgi:hypothetical protein
MRENSQRRNKKEKLFETKKQFCEMKGREKLSKESFTNPKKKHTHTHKMRHKQVSTRELIYFVFCLEPV